METSYQEIHRKPHGIQAFWDSFQVAIDTKMDKLNGIEKLNYLHTYLEGPATATIAGLALAVRINGDRAK